MLPMVNRLGNARAHFLAFEIEVKKNIDFRVAEQTPARAAVGDSQSLAYVRSGGENNRPVTSFPRSSSFLWTHKSTLGRACRLRNLYSL